MKKVLMKLMDRFGGIQEGIEEIRSSSCSSSYLNMKLADGFEVNDGVLDSDNEILTSNVELISAYEVEIPEVIEVNQEESRLSKGEKFHRSEIIKDNQNEEK